MKLIFLIISILLSILHNSTSVDIDCSYEYYTFTVVGSTYHCDIRSDPNIISEETAIINRAKGGHYSYKTDDDVKGLYSSSKKIEYFPRGLEEIFKNLELIAIHYGRISEIHQSDLKPFTKLKYFNLAYNNIKVIEKGLFDFNPDLAYVSFSNNDVEHIYPQVFNELTMLRHLILESNNCIDRRADDSAYQVKEIIKSIATSCPYVGPTDEPETSTKTTAKQIKDTDWEIDSDEVLDDDSLETLSHPRDTRIRNHSVWHGLNVLLIGVVGIAYLTV